MKLSEKRRQAIYDAIYDRIMAVRLDLARRERDGNPASHLIVDHLLFRASVEAGQAAIRAAERGPREGE